MKFKLSFLLLLPLLLAGCSKPHDPYAPALNLPALTPPAVLAPIGPMGDAIKAQVDKLENASKASEAEEVESFVLEGGPLMALIGGEQFNKEENKAEFDRMMAYLGQAAQIKAAQLKDGDSRDSTGEVTERLQYVRQSAANFDFLANKTK